MESTKGAVRQMTMVERMARAMAAADNDCQDGAWPHYTRYALAALRELREPTEVMVVAAEAKAQEMVDASPAMTRWHGDELIAAAIDAIIAEHEAAR